MNFTKQINPKGILEKGEKLSYKQANEDIYAKTVDHPARFKEKRTIYFAHPFDKWHSKREEMIERILEGRNYKVINPFKEEDRLNEKYGVNHYYENPTYDFAKDIVDKDYDMVKHCHEYFGWFPKDITMIGTPIELVWAYNMHKKITVLCYKPQPFLWILADVFYIDYDAFVKDEPFWKKAK